MLFHAFCLTFRLAPDVLEALTCICAWDMLGKWLRSVPCSADSFAGITPLTQCLFEIKDRLCSVSSETNSFFFVACLALYLIAATIIPLEQRMQAPRSSSVSFLFRWVGSGFVCSPRMGCLPPRRQMSPETPRGRNHLNSQLAARGTSTNSITIRFVFYFALGRRDEHWQCLLLFADSRSPSCWRLLRSSLMVPRDASTSLHAEHLRSDPIPEIPPTRRRCACKLKSELLQQYS